jgi:hypothetical protein
MNIRYLFALLVSMAVSPAYAWTNESITITGGTFTLSDSSNTFGAVPVLAGPSNTLDDGVINGMVDADGLHGSEVSPVTTFMFLGIPWKTFFAHSVETLAPPCNPGCSLISIADPEPGAITVTGSPYDSAITADFSGFFTEWNGNRFWQGGQATGTGEWVVQPTVEGGSGIYNFTLHWSLVNSDGPFQGFTSDWVLTGTAVAVVPEPEAYALMLAGLGLIAGAVRRRRNSSATYPGAYSTPTRLPIPTQTAH